MNILFLGGNLAKELAEWLREQREEVIYREDRITIEDIKKINPDFVISYNYKFLVSKDIIEFVKGNIINLHISFLPWNRGAHPNVWSFLEDTPTGVSIHYVDEGIDTGNIIVQKEVYIDEDKESLRSSYEKLHKELQELFKENWAKIKLNKIKAKKQVGGVVSTTVENSNCLSRLSKKRAGILLSKNLRKDLRIGNVTLKNFVNLANQERIMILRWRNNEHIRKWSYSEHIISKAEHVRFINRLKEDENNFYYLVQRRNSQYVGVISLNKLNFNHKNAYLGIYSNPKLTGVGSLLMESLKDVAFKIAKLHSLKLEVIENNKRAIRFYKKHRFKQEGRLKEFVYKDGKWLDVIVMGIVNNDDKL